MSVAQLLDRDLIRVKPRPSIEARRERLARREERLAEMFPLARQIVDARSHAARAALVLRFSDDIVLGHFASLTAACNETGFTDGQHYLLERYASLIAVRDEWGLWRGGDRLELFRRGLAALAHRVAR